jgi:hypothetical protein
MMIGYLINTSSLTTFGFDAPASSFLGTPNELAIASIHYPLVVLSLAHKSH